MTQDESEDLASLVERVLAQVLSDDEPSSHKWITQATIVDALHHSTDLSIDEVLSRLIDSAEAEDAS